MGCHPRDVCCCVHVFLLSSASLLYYSNNSNDTHTYERRHRLRSSPSLSKSFFLILAITTTTYTTTTWEFGKTVTKHYLGNCIDLLKYCEQYFSWNHYAISSCGFWGLANHPNHATAHHNYYMLASLSLTHTLSELTVMINLGVASLVLLYHYYY